jgi:hypothetical protein
MKYMTPFWMILTLTTNTFLAFTGDALYIFLLMFQLILYISAFVGLVRKNGFGKSRLIEICYSYVLVNIAYLWGWLKYLRGETYTSWSPDR